MKQLFTLLAAIALLSACSNLNQIITVNDDFKNEKSIRLIQELEGYSDERLGGLREVDYIIDLKTLYFKPENLPGRVLADLTVNTEARPENLDSLIFLEVDGEKFQFTSIKNASLHFIDQSTSTSTTTSTEKEKDQEKEKKSEKTSVTTETTINSQTRQVMKLTFEIPREIWEQVLNPEQLKLRFYIENEGVTVRFTSRDRKKFAELFHTILQFEKSQRNS